MKRVQAMVVVGVIGGVLAAGCGRDATRDSSIRTTSAGEQSTAAAASDAEKRGVALVRAVYAIPAGANVDVFADDARIFDGLAYRAATAYRELKAERYSLRLRPAGMNRATPLASNSERLSAGGYYTLFLLPGDGEAATLRVATDHNVPADAARARLRIVHASRDAGELDVYATGRQDALFDGVDFQSVTDYHAIEPVAGPLELRPDHQPAAMLTVPDVHLDAGKSYTLVVVGRVRTAPKLETLLVGDEAVPSAVATR